jgi:hypothetical protein
MIRAYVQTVMNHETKESRRNIMLLNKQRKCEIQQVAADYMRNIPEQKGLPSSTGPNISTAIYPMY